MVVRLSALNALCSLLTLWDLDPEQCLAPALGWLVPALYGMFGDVAEMDNRQQVGDPTHAALLMSVFMVLVQGLVAPGVSERFRWGIKWGLVLSVSR